jgi:hypothetical protein
VGFNYRQPGRIKRADWIMLAAAAAVVAVLVIWAVH